MNKSEIEKLYEECIKSGHFISTHKKIDSEYDLSIEIQQKAISVVDFLRNQKGRGKPISLNDFQKLVFKLLEDVKESTVYCPRCGSCGVIGCCETERCELVGCLYGEIHAAEYKSQKELIIALEKLCKEHNVPMDDFYKEFYKI